MSNEYFRFKQFSVCQDRCAMKVGTDGVLLGAWAPLSQARRILDIGTGTGIISLMAAQRAPQATIDAVELDEMAASQARENFDNSPWSSRLAVHQCSIQEYVADRAGEGAVLYDFIVSNPPFFEESTMAPEERRRMARSAGASLPLSDLFRCVSGLLADGGKFALIYPPTSDSSVQMAAALCRMSVECVCEVKTVEHKPVKRIMALFGRGGGGASLRREVLSMRIPGGDYSPAYKALTGDFYL